MNKAAGYILRVMTRKLTDFLFCQDSLEINGVGLGVGAAQFVRCLPKMLEVLGSIILNAYKPALWCSILSFQHSGQ